MPNPKHFVDGLYPRYKASGLAKIWKLRRYRQILKLLNLDKNANILDVGCGSGADFIRFALDDEFQAHGLDIALHEHITRFNFTIGDATALPFPDHHFDAVVSVGVFEHIQPIEKLCTAAQEISRVGKTFCVLVPSIGTLIEPHTLAPLWGIRDHNRKHNTSFALNYLSDEGWLQLAGFAGASTKRAWYLPGMQNLLIYRNQTS